MSALSVIFAGPLLLASLTVLLRRWPGVAAAAGAIGAALLALAVSVVAPGAGEAALQWEPLGRALILDAAAGRILTLLYGGAAALLLLAALWPQGRDFAPSLAAALAPLALAIMVRPFVYGAAALVVAAAFQVALIQSGQPGSTRSATRYLLVMALALPFFLVAGWMVDSGQLVFLRTLWQLVLLGIVLLLAGAPFHFWVRPLFAEASPLSVVFVLGLAQLALVSFAATALGASPALAQTGLSLWLRVAGVATMAVAGIMALAATRPHQAVAYAALLDMGAVLAALGAGPAGLPPALLMVLGRTLALVLAMVGLAYVEPRPRTAASDPLAYDGARWPLFLLAYGAFSLLGLPLTPGFAGRWAEIALLGQQSPWLAAVTLLAVAAAAAGVWRSLPPATLPSLRGWRTGWPLAPVQAAAALLLLLAILLTLFPAWPRALVALLIT
jgi:NADH:ubiquinone oxidoreductase subunit 2 (subunit N)